MAWSARRKRRARPAARPGLSLSRAAGAALALLAAFPAAELCAATPHVEYIYVEPAAGASSGGHAGLRIDERVYHFQHVDPGLIRIRAESPERFDHGYRTHGNRALHVRRLAVPEPVAAALRRGFAQQLLIQDRQSDVLEALDQEIALLEHLACDASSAARICTPPGPPPLRLPGTGYFLPDLEGAAGTREEVDDVVSTELPGLSSLAQTVVQTRGVAHLPTRIASLRQELDELRPPEHGLRVPMPSLERFEALPVGLDQRTREVLGNLVALEVLATGARLRAEAVIEAPGASVPLNAPELARLREHVAGLRTAALDLLGSRRPDWGRPLLLTMARMLVLEFSIERQRLFLLVSHDEEPRVLAAPEVERHAPNLARILDEREAEWLALREAFFRESTWSERAFADLERTLNRVRDLDRALADPGGRNLPALESRVPALGARRSDWSLPRADTEQLRSALEATRIARDQFEAALVELYPYDVVQRNCVTEIFREVERSLALASGEDSGLALGDAIELAGTLNFIPLVSGWAVDESWPVEASEIRPSYRAHMLEQASRGEQGWGFELRESNTVTSELYRRPSEDSIFLFFTDEALLPRPLFGAANMVVASGALLVGLTVGPFDGGDLLTAAAKGMVYSVPELVFLNIRTGTFPFVPVGWESTASGNEGAVRGFDLRAP